MSLRLKIAGVIALMFATLLAIVQFAHANPGTFTPPVSTASATTTQTYVSFGVGTTTLTVDTYYANSAANYTKANGALLLFQFYSTSTLSIPIVKVAVEYSDDNLDWYPQTFETTANASSTYMTGNYGEYVFAIATTTATTRVGGTSSTTVNVTNRQHLSLKVDVPTRYVRFVFYGVSGGGNGALWAQAIPWKEQR